MVCKTSLSNAFRGLPIDHKLIMHILGKPITYKGKDVGTIIGVDPEKDTISIEIDDWYADEFVKTYNFEIVGR